MRNEAERVCSRYNILISGKIIKEMPGSVASGTDCIYVMWQHGAVGQHGATSPRNI